MKDGQLYFIPKLIPPYYSSHSWGVDWYVDRAARDNNLVCKTQEQAEALADTLILTLSQD